MTYTYKDVELFGDLILIEPTVELNTLVQKIQVPDDTKNTGKRAKDNAIKITKEIEEKYNTIYQVATILSVGNGARHDIKPGDKVVYNFKNAKALDLFAKEYNDKTCPQTITSWDIIGKVE